ncbi:hypothetical protein KIPB_009926, partial [Kipferlia bialata]
YLLLSQLGPHPSAATRSQTVLKLRQHTRPVMEEGDSTMTVVKKEGETDATRVVQPSLVVLPQARATLCVVGITAALLTSLGAVDPGTGSMLPLQTVVDTLVHSRPHLGATRHHIDSAAQTASQTLTELGVDRQHPTSSVKKAEVSLKQTLLADRTHTEKTDSDSAVREDEIDPVCLSLFRASVSGARPVDASPHRGSFEVTGPALKRPAQSSLATVAQAVATPKRRPVAQEGKQQDTPSRRQQGEGGSTGALMVDELFVTKHLVSLSDKPSSRLRSLYGEDVTDTATPSDPSTPLGALSTMVDGVIEELCK